MKPTVVRDVVTGHSYDVLPDQAVHPVGTIVEYVPVQPPTVASVKGLVAGTVTGDSVSTDIGLKIPLRSDLRSVYPDGTKVKFSGTPERVFALDALTWDLGAPARRVDVTDNSGSVPKPLSRLGISIEQDSKDKTDFDTNQAYYHLGAAGAWTTRVHTCAVFAMWSRTARISYLSHADAGTSPVTVSEYVAEYLAQAVKGGADLDVPGELTVVILLADDTLGQDSTSLQVLSLSLNHLPTAQAAAVYRNARCHLIQPDDYVVVQAGGPPRVLLLPDTRVTYLLKQYTRSPTPALRDLLAQSVPAPVPIAWPRFEPTLIFDAAQGAKAQGHDTLLPVFARLVGYRDGNEARQRLWGS
ncbi:hypothetical protein [Sphaerisporangium corydalis]|uniref:Uncharacterized protein n=1 Tax=Sphaerisporangium corydalis TaxID=1441875 RepID=A0ABV9ERW4_9ACTN|nr:hypothetical protein [Sphaerisporangium corydalis]